jgi:hypothetical protein
MVIRLSESTPSVFRRMAYASEAVRAVVNEDPGAVENE